MMLDNTSNLFRLEFWIIPDAGNGVSMELNVEVVANWPGKGH